MDCSRVGDVVLKERRQEKPDTWIASPPRGYRPNSPRQRCFLLGVITFFAALMCRQCAYIGSLRWPAPWLPTSMVGCRFCFLRLHGCRPQAPAQLLGSPCTQKNFILPKPFCVTARLSHSFPVVIGPHPFFGCCVCEIACISWSVQSRREGFRSLHAAVAGRLQHSPATASSNCPPSTPPPRLSPAIVTNTHALCQHHFSATIVLSAVCSALCPFFVCRAYVVEVSFQLCTFCVRPWISCLPRRFVGHGQNTAFAPSLVLSPSILQSSVTSPGCTPLSSAIPCHCSPGSESFFPHPVVFSAAA